MDVVSAGIIMILLGIAVMILGGIFYILDDDKKGKKEESKNEVRIEK